MSRGAGLELALLSLSPCTVLETPGKFVLAPDLLGQAEVLGSRLLWGSLRGARMVQGGVLTSFGFVGPAWMCSLSETSHHAVLGVPGPDLSLFPADPRVDILDSVESYGALGTTRTSVQPSFRLQALHPLSFSWVQFLRRGGTAQFSQKRDTLCWALGHQEALGRGSGSSLHCPVGDVLTVGAPSR